MQIKKLFRIGAAFALSGCASIHSGNFAEPEATAVNGSKHASNSGIVISGGENAELSSFYFGEVDFTFENRGSDWVRIHDVTLDFGDDEINAAVKVPVGQDLVAWAKAAEQNKQIHDYNTALVLGSVMLIGEAALIGSRDSHVQAPGAVAMIGAAGGLGVMALHDERQKLLATKLVPPTHLMAEDFVIPPGLHAKKWITFYTKEPKKIHRIKTVTIAYALEDGRIERAKLAFRAQDSQWQSF